MVVAHTTDTLHRLKTEALSLDEALAICDSLEAVSVDFMIGRWRGSEVRTNHPYVGVLERSGWYGKLFLDENNVHPLIFYKNDHALFSVNPSRIAAGIDLPIDYNKLPNLRPTMPFLSPLLQTREGKARLRMTEYRGVVSATMIYDALPINDVFRKLNEGTVLGIMDRRDDTEPYFFLLERDDTKALTLDL
ncbi:MAG: DUF4334 domain-containing protein [Chloroflexota bacterium]